MSSLPRGGPTSPRSTALSRLLVLALLLVVVGPATAVPDTDEGIERLPRSVVPTSYRLDLATVFDESNSTFHGEVWIDVEISVETDRIVLHSSGLNILKATVDNIILPAVEDGKVVFIDEPDTNNFTNINKPPRPHNSSHVSGVKDGQKGGEKVGIKGGDQSGGESIVSGVKGGVKGGEKSGESDKIKGGNGSGEANGGSGGEGGEKDVIKGGHQSGGDSGMSGAKGGVKGGEKTGEKDRVKGGNTSGGESGVSGLTGGVKGGEKTGEKDRVKGGNTSGGESGVSGVKGGVKGGEKSGDNDNIKLGNMSGQASGGVGGSGVKGPVSVEDGGVKGSGEWNREKNGVKVPEKGIENSGATSGTDVQKVQKHEETIGEKQNANGTAGPADPDRTVFPEEPPGDKVPNVWSLLYNVSGDDLLSRKPEMTDVKVNSSAAWLQLYQEPETRIWNSAMPDIQRRSAVKGGAKVGGLKIEVNRSQQFLILHLPSKLKAKSKHRIYLKYSGQLSKDLSGYYSISYKDVAANRTRWMSSTVFEPASARRAFPCFDEPNLKARFQINLARPKEMTSLSNMALSTTTPMPGRAGWEVDHYILSPLMPTYLVAFHVGNLKPHVARPDPRADPAVPGKPFTIWTRPAISRKQTEYALGVGPQFERFFEQYLEVKNPLKKTDILALPNILGEALENWGLISFEEKYILHQPGASPITNQQSVATILAHELAHYWFGNTVTLDWWSSVWLNEGFATYFATLAVDAVHPEWGAATSQAVRGFLKVFSVDALFTSHALIAKAETPRDLTQLFDTIAYYKGSYILRMIHHALGDATFRRGIQHYVKRHQFGNANKDDPWASLTYQAHKDGTLPPGMDLRVLTESWTRRPGYPVVTAIRDYATGTVDVIQNRFLRPKEDVEARAEAEEGEDTEWWIPLTYTTQDRLDFQDTRPRTWLDPGELVTTLRDGIPEDRDKWLLMNVNVTGLYRVKYDGHNWELLSRYLNSPNYHRISVLNRAQLLDDVLDFARAGEMSYDDALNLTLYMTRERHYLPWVTAFSNIDYIQRMFRTTNSSHAFERYIQQLISPLYHHLGFNSPTNESFNDMMNRQQIIRWACQTRLQTCIDQARILFRQWQTNERHNSTVNPIASSLRPAVYCTAIEHGTREDWLYLWRKYLTAHVGSERSAIVAALGCVRDKDILKQYLAMSIQEASGIRKQDSASVFKAVVKNNLGVDIAKRFLMENIEKIQTMFVDYHSHIPILLDSLASTMNLQSQLDELEEFEMAQLRSLRSSDHLLQMSHEKLKFNVEWLTTNYQQITNWLESRGLHSTHRANTRY